MPLDFPFGINNLVQGRQMLLSSRETKWKETIHLSAQKELETSPEINVSFFSFAESKAQKGVTYPSTLTYSSSKTPADKAGKWTRVVSSTLYARECMHMPWCASGGGVGITILPGQAPLALERLSPMPGNWHQNQRDQRAVAWE